MKLKLGQQYCSCLNPVVTYTTVLTIDETQHVGQIQGNRFILYHGTVRKLKEALEGLLDD